MTHNGTRILVLFFAALALAALFCACAARKPETAPSPIPAVTSPSPSAATDTPSPKPSSTPQPEPTASPSPIAVETAQPSPSLSSTATPFAINPLYAFYNEYSSAAKPAISALRERLGSIAGAEALSMSLMTDAHQRALSCIYVSVCRLIDNGGSYYATLDGAAAGSGTMSVIDGIYTFEYAYDDGSVLSGEYHEDEKVEFTLSSRSDKSICAIIKTAEGFTSTVDEMNSESRLEFASDGSVVFALDLRQVKLIGDELYIDDYLPPIDDIDAITFATS